MEAKHTPGPWTLVEINSETVKGAVHVYGGGAPITTDVWGPTLAESDANARLIVAAPDLLAALRDLVEKFHKEAPRCSLGYTYAAREAIAKATGQATGGAR